MVDLVTIAVCTVIDKENSTRVFVLDDSQVLDVNILINLMAVLSREHQFDDFSLRIKIVDDFSSVRTDSSSEYAYVEGL